MKSLAVALSAVAVLVSAHAEADSGEAVYKARCSLCHEGGAGGAPKIGNREDWAPRAARGRLALYEVALNGKPNTAMMARGGFRDLSNDEVMAAADYMIAKTGLDPGNFPDAPAEVDDKTITAHIADALCELAPPGAKVELLEGAASIGGLGIKVTTREGVVSLTGMVKNAEIIERAEAIAKSAEGVKKVESKLIAASIFEWD